MLSRFPALITRMSAFATHWNSPYMSQTVPRVVSMTPMIATPVWTQIRGFKDKEVLKLRCDNCYFTKIDDRLWVLCNTHPRHKQRQRVDDERRKWIVTHITRTGRPFKKHYQYPGHDL